MLLNLKEGEYLGQDLKSRGNGFFNLSITNYEPHDEVSKHYHDNSYLSILTKGKYTEKANHNVSAAVIPGEILFRPASYVHENLFEDNGGTCFNIEFKSEWFRYFDTKLALPTNFTQYKPGYFPSLYKLLINFRQDYHEDSAMEFIADWLFQVNEKNVYTKPQPWLENVSRILENELDEFHSLQILAGRVFVHPVYLARAFKEKTGLTIGEYQLKAKLANALSLLLNTNLSLSDISGKNGFFDDAHFVRSFKKIYKISPHQFRLSTRKLI
ncbi:MAG: AraC family transcriptional regulator [Chitinophagaceae bacterium]